MLSPMTAESGEPGLLGVEATLVLVVAGMEKLG